MRSGPRTVIWPEPKIYLGNFLYHWLQVHLRRGAGRDVVCLETEPMRGWIRYFPGVEPTLVTRDQVRMRDRREVGFFQAWGLHYRPPELDAFVDFLLDTTTLPLVVAPADPGRVVVNVRRGDYFHPQFIHRYSFNVAEYIEVAIHRAAILGGPVTSIHVVSDDIPWCRDNLMWLGQDGATLTYQLEDSTPADDFVTLAAARRLILGNSTFGYWAAHFSSRLHRDNDADIVVPWFHDRTVWEGGSYHLNPAWTVIRHLPHGWGPESPTAAPGSREITAN